ncbi:MAG: hypothetical protein DRG11_01940 [Epsilonproteobacteria bacterium]|nr:MAG: hypothetical protein DRG11_01940 [Campylobacterota bacterium]
MVVDKFFYVLVVVVFALIFISTNTTIKQIKKQDNPLMIVENFVLNRHDNNNTGDEIAGKKYTKYLKYEYFENVILNIKYENKYTKIATNKIKKTENILSLEDNIIFENQDIQFKTNKLKYDTNKTIAQTDDKYNAVYGGLHISGEKLYVDIKQKIIKSNKITMTQGD